MDKLKDTDYYKELCKNIDYLQSIEDFEKEKSEVQKKFRNIDSETVIPLKVYEENIDIINECITIVNQKFDECMNEREKKDLKLRKISSKDRLMGFTVNIRGEEVKDYKEKELRINKYESIPIVRCKYDNEIGVLFSNEDKNKNIRSTNMF